MVRLQEEEYEVIIHAMRTIEKKLWPRFFQGLLDGKKTFTIRLADFECEPGDVIVFREWDPTTKEYTGRSMEKKVALVERTKDISFWSQEDVEKFGLQVIGFH